jgi:hypothetical protein
MWAATLGVALAVIAGLALSAAPAAAATLPFGTVKAVAAQSPSDLRSVKSFSAICPAGQRVLGGGAFTVGGIHAVITEMQPIHPNTGQDSFKVTAAADQFGIPVAWGFQVFAFCATVPTSLQLEIKPHTNLPTSGATDQASTQCSPGKFLIGTGGKIDNGGGQVDLGMFPNSSGQIAFGSAAFAKEDADGFAGQYTVTGYSVCGRPNDIFGDFAMVRTTFQAAGGAPSLKGTVGCPSGMAVTGLAGGTATPGTHLQQIAPTTAGRPATLATFGAQSSVTPSGTWQMDTSLFCAR